MALRTRLSAAYTAFRNPGVVARDQGVPLLGVEIPDDDIDRYRLMDLYKDNEVYRQVKALLIATASPEDFPRIRALENPPLQVVQFHVMHVLAGPMSEALPLTGGEQANQALIDAVNRVFQWGNMAAMKDSIVEDAATYGDVWLRSRVRADATQVYPESRHPGEVTLFEEDHMRNTKRIRLDVELDPEEQPDRASMWTEYWDHDANLYVAWRHRQGRRAKLDTLGTAYEGPLPITDLGHDFVPFVRFPYEAGARPNRRCKGIFERHLEALDSINRTTTELDEMYRDNAEGVWAALRGESGRDAIETVMEERAANTPSTEEVRHGRRIVKFPGLARLEDMVPDIDYEAGLKKIEDRRLALERSLSELRFFRGIDSGDPAAAAIRQHMAPAISRAAAGRGNAEDSILRVAKQCVSMGQAVGLFGREAGIFEAGDFDNLAFKKRPILPEDPDQLYQRRLTRADVWQRYQSLGLLAWYLEHEEGYPTAVAVKLAADAGSASQAQAARERVNDPAFG